MASAIAAALSQDRTFKEQVTRPAQRHLQKVLTNITKEKTDVIELKFKEATLTDEVAMSQIHERYLRNQAMTPNEVRDVLGLTQIKGGDKVLELNAKTQANQRQNAAGTSERQRERVNEQSDGPATVEGRNPKGEGARVE